MPWTWGCDVSVLQQRAGHRTPPRERGVLELMRREGDVYVGQSSGSEIDFVTNGPGGRRYYQVSESVHDSATLDREPSSLRAVRDNYPKTLITLDDERPYSHEGIRQIYALDWLLNEDHKKQ